MARSFEPCRWLLSGVHGFRSSHRGIISESQKTGFKKKGTGSTCPLRTQEKSLSDTEI
jgi:hypothetical protein